VRSTKLILAVVASLVVLGVLPSCGGHSGEKASATRATIASSNVVVIDRTVASTSGIHVGGYFFNFPAHVTVTNRARVRALVAALKRLPRYRTDLSRCHALGRPKYTLRFEIVSSQVRRSTVARVTVDFCGEVTGLGHPRLTARYFWRAFGKAVGAPHGKVVIGYRG
jgi:hypothetical protein